MILTKADGTSFEMKLLGYQFPKIETADYDSNWLIIEINVNHRQKNWTAKDPCMLNYEVLRLANWLEEISTGGKVNAPAFIEPSLTFSVFGLPSGRRVINIQIKYGLSPNWDPKSKKRDEDWQLDFPVDEINVGKAVASLRRQYEKFPQRASK